ncbi:MAG: hypothetical protein JWR00_1489 [Rubritepida sp.]|nr:hypothetical protein [Rubritepida sp.]
MPDFLSKPCTAFQGTSCLARGPLIDVALTVKAAMEASPASPFLTFEDATGTVVDLDLRGTAAEIVARLAHRAEMAALPSRPPDQPATKDESPVQGRGRPRLGVVAREVTLLPRHWDWLALQQRSASQTLRRLIDEARRDDAGRSEARAAQAAAYKFLSSMAGNLAGFEEATRALFAGDRDGFAGNAATWPPDIRTYAQTLMRNRTGESGNGEAPESRATSPKPD